MPVTVEQRRKRTRFLTSNWVITLTATLVGVFLALYLNEQVASRKLNDQKAIATQNILAELTSNQEELENAVPNHVALLETMTFLNRFLDEEENFIAPIDSMNSFRARNPGVVVISDSTLLGKGMCQYEGEINMDLAIPHIALSSIALETFKNSGLSVSYDFDCLMFIELIDKLTKRVQKKDGELLEIMKGLRDPGEKNEKLIKHLTMLVEFERFLLEAYKANEGELKNCG